MAKIYKNQMVFVTTENSRPLPPLRLHRVLQEKNDLVCLSCENHFVTSLTIMTDKKPNRSILCRSIRKLMKNDDDVGSRSLVPTSLYQNEPA
jgi:hypothetical protein